MAEEKTILEVFGEKSKDADELVPSTLEEYAHTQRGQSMDVLLKALTKGGEERFLHSYQPTTEDEEGRKVLREWIANMLRMEIEKNPAYADTLSKEEGLEQVAPRKNWLMRALGY